MAEQVRFERLLKMMFLLSGNVKYSVDELADKLELSRRSVYRNIQTFRDAGFIITGDNKYFQIDKTSPYLRSLNDLLHFTKEESWILNKAIMALDDDIPIKNNLANKLYFLYDIKGVPYPVTKKEQSRKITMLIRAIEEKKQVVFTNYLSPNSKTIRDRVVEAYEFTLNYHYVWCYDVQDQKSKLFKTARIQEVQVMETDWQFSDNHEPLVVDLFRIAGKKKFRVSLILSMRAASLLTEEYPMAEEELVELDENSFRFKTEVCSYNGIGRFILGLMDDIVVESPVSLKKFLNDKIREKKF